MSESAIFFALKAEEYAKKHKLRKAIKVCKQGIRDYPDYQTAYIILGNLLLAKKEKKKAARIVHQGLSIFSASKALAKLKEQISAFKPGLYRTFMKPSLSYIFILIFVIFGFLIIVPSVFTDFSSGVAEKLRGVFGASFVARLEELSFDVQDYYNDMIYRMGDNQRIDFIRQSVNKVNSKNKSVIASRITKIVNLPDKRKSDSIQNKFRDNFNSVNIDLNNLTWDNFLQFNNDVIMFNKKVYPDDERPYSQVFFIKIRLDKIKVSLNTTGKIPATDQNDNLLAAFNGGFRHVHGGYGMMIDGDELYPAKKNIGTFVIYKSGKIDILKWNQSMDDDTGILTYRQNCPLILENSQINDEINHRQAVWGYTIDNKVLTWRSGVGITPDKKYLIYGFGKSLSVESLANAFKIAGAGNAMQLDINWGWTKFVLFNRDDDVLTAKRIIANSSVRKYEYLRQSENISVGRDFFYLSYKY